MPRLIRLNSAGHLEIRTLPSLTDSKEHGSHLPKLQKNRIYCVLHTSVIWLSMIEEWRQREIQETMQFREQCSRTDFLKAERILTCLAP